MPYSEKHAAARNYAEFGWPIFPVVINGKEPACANGYLDATTDLDQIDAWWDEADWNIGFCPENAGICVVDEDTDKGGKYERDTPTVKTPHGKHLYYAGSLPNTSSKLAPAVDTRGRGGYVLVPPSIVDGQKYIAVEPSKFPCEFFELDTIPDYIIERCQSNARPRDRSEPITNNSWDRPKAIKLFKRFLEDKPPIGADEPGDDYAAACRALDLGISCERFMKIVEEYGGDPEYAERNYINAENYRQNAEGCDIPLTATEANAALIKNTRTAQRPLATERATGDTLPRLKGRPCRPRETLKEITYFDQDHLIPNSPEGSVGILFGKRGDHKTNTLLSLLSNSSAKRILYAAGEGTFGVERDRIPAHAGLTDKLYIVPGVPSLSDPVEVQEFIELNNGYAPDIVVIDTWATAIGAEDDNTSSTAFQLSDNGTCGAIKRAWNCAVVVVDHTGKDKNRGVRGSSAKEGNVDFVIEVEADKKNAVIKATVTKMRDGYDGIITYWSYENDPTKVPVPARITEKEYIEKTAITEPDNSLGVSTTVISYLRLHDHHTWGTGLETPELANALCEQENGDRPNDPDEAAEWDTARAKWRISLNGARNKSWAKKCNDTQIPSGGNEMTLRWFCPPEGQEEL